MLDNIINPVVLDKALIDEDLEIIREILVSYLLHSDIRYVLDKVIYNLFASGSDDLLVSLVDSKIISSDLFWDKYSIVTHATWRGSLSFVEKLCVSSNKPKWFPPSTALYESASAGYIDIFNYLLPLVKNAPTTVDDEIERLVELNVCSEEIELLTTSCYQQCIDILNTFLRSKEINNCICYAKQASVIEQNSDSLVANDSQNYKRLLSFWIKAFLGERTYLSREILLGLPLSFQIDFTKIPELKSKALLLHNIKPYLAFEDRRNCNFRPYQRSTFQGLTPLMACIAGGSLIDCNSAKSSEYLQSIELLCSNEVDLNVQDYYGNTALHWAILTNWVDAVQFLIKKSIDPSIKNLLGYSPSMLARTIGNPRVIQLIEKVDHQFSGHEYISLIDGVLENDLSSVNNALSKGLNSNFSDHLGNPALCIAVQKGMLEMSELLIRNGANLNFPMTCSDDSALLTSVRLGNYEIAELLANSNCDLNHQGRGWGETAIIESVRHQDLDILRLLLKYGGDTGVTDYFGHTALDYVEIYSKFFDTTKLIEIGLLILNS